MGQTQNVTRDIRIVMKTKKNKKSEILNWKLVNSVSERNIAWGGCDLTFGRYNCK